jgi:hypothetical protein
VVEAGGELRAQDAAHRCIDALGRDATLEHRGDDRVDRFGRARRHEQDVRARLDRLDGDQAVLSATAHAVHDERVRDDKAVVMMPSTPAFTAARNGTSSTS